MNREKRIINIDFGIAQGLYWAVFCITSSFAALYLQHKGYTNSELGVILAFGSIICLFLSPGLAGLMDKNPSFTAEKGLAGLLAFQIVTILIIHFIIPGKSLILSVFYASFLACMICTNPMNTQLCMNISAKGLHINYGACRAVGSLTYSVSSIVLGAAVERSSAEILLPIASVLIVFQIITLWVMHRRTKALSPAEKGTVKAEESTGLLGFMLRYRRYSIFLIGTSLLYFTHCLFNTYFINIVRNLGGDAADMGRITGFMAIVELPAMILLDTLCRRVRISKVMRIGMVFFAAKFVFSTFAPNLTVLFACQIFQGLGFAFVVPGLVRYAEAVIPAADSAKSQSLSYNTSTLGYIFSSFLGGMMFDDLPVKTALIISSVIALAGLVICQIGIEDKAE